MLAALLASAARAADPPSASPPQPVLHLADGGFAAGEIRDFDQARGPALAGRVVRRPRSISRQGGQRDPVAAAGDAAQARPAISASSWPPATCSSARWSALNDKEVELDIPRLGRIHVQRSNLHRIYRWRDGADLIYLGPNGLLGWHEPAGQKNWREELGPAETDREGSSIRGDFGLPRSRQHRVRDLLEDQARLRLRPGRRRQGQHGQARLPVRGVGRRPGRPARARAGSRPGRRAGGRGRAPAAPISRPTSTRRRAASWSSRRAASSWPT